MPAAKAKKPKTTPKPPRAYSGYMQRATGEEPTTPKPAKPPKPAYDPRPLLGPNVDLGPINPLTNSAYGPDTQYHPSFKDKVIALGKIGYSPCQIASELNVDRSTMINWGERDGEEAARFKTALARAKCLEQAWYEQKGREGLESRHFNAHLWVKIMACRFRQDYADKLELTGADGGPILFQTVYEEPPKTIDVVANPKPPL